MSGNGWSRDYAWQASLDKLPVMVVDRAGVRRAVDMSTWKGERPVCWRKGLLGAIVSRDEIAPGDLRWHVSIQHRDRLPRWEEVAAAAHELRPGVAFAIGIPPRSWWVNLSPRVLHVTELRDDALIASWRRQGRGDVPT